MLVVFSSQSSGDITMFGDVAIHMLKLMGHKGTVPGAFSEEDVPAALESLEAAIREAKPEPETEVSLDDDGVTPVSLAHRAMPLLDMLRAAVANDSYVMWVDNDNDS